jgi:predicted sulfurtransferase
MDHPQGFLNLVRDAKKRIKEEDYRETKKKMDSGHPMILVDTREDSEWARGHIPGAVHLSKERSRTRMQKLSCIVAADTAPPWRLTIFRKWAIAT